MLTAVLLGKVMLGFVTSVLICDDFTLGLFVVVVCLKATSNAFAGDKK